MRDERWVNRFHFTWNDSLFFDPLDAYYTPRADHFLSGLDEQTRARFVRSGIWWTYRRDAPMPPQGWKIHVSATHRNVHRTADTVLAYLLEHGPDFKIALDTNIFETLNSKAMARGSGGKLVTVYPADADEFRRCLSDLDRLLAGAQGPYILSDLRYRDCEALYFRYGQFTSTHQIDALGRRIPSLTGPDGPLPDDREPGGQPPSWAPWPFPADQLPAPTDGAAGAAPSDGTDPDAGSGPDGQEDEDLLGGRFLVTAAIQFSNSGGVYEAKDTADGNRLVVLKEARPHTNPNLRRGQDAVDLLGREWTFLNRLAGCGSFPAPIASFRQWEHHFIAEELVAGTDMRLIMLQESPLVRPGFDLERSRRFLRIFLAVMRGLARAVREAHDRQVVLGDLTPANILVDPDTYAVTVIDLESCRLDGEPAGAAADEAGLHEPVDLFTPGFSHSRRAGTGADVPDDVHSLAVNMAYFIFPIAAMLYLREDVLELYRTFTDGLGWPAEIHRSIVDLAAGRLSLAELQEFLADEERLVGLVTVPQPAPVAEDRRGPADVEAGVAAFTTAVADPDRSTLFPVDPFAHVSNPLSLGFGASGVLWALHESGVAVRPEWSDWLRERLHRLDDADYPVGLMSGLAGIAWAADGLGLHEEAGDLLARADLRIASTRDYSFYYGLAGLGMANLHAHRRHRAADHLDAALACGHRLAETAHREDGQAHWLNEFSTDVPFTGLGFGQAGVAMFLLRLSEATGDPSWRELGGQALAWELAHAETLDDGSLWFRHQGTLEPYLEVGGAGVAQVLLRYGELDAAEKVLRGLEIAYSVLPGYGFGLCGVADAMLDAARITGDPGYRRTALRQLDFVRRVFLFRPPDRLLPSVPGATEPGATEPGGPVPLAVPGEGLLRCSCDLMTGSAGVLRVLHRANHGGPADFLLDEVRR